MTKLIRPSEGRIIGGVCQGIANSLNLDPTPARAAANGYFTVGGHVMLAHQAFSQFEQFTGLSAPREEMVAALQEELRLRNL